MPTKKEPQTPDQQDTLFAPKAETEKKQKESWEIWAEQREAERKAKNIYQKLQEAKVTVQQSIKSKSGNNKYAGFQYLELADFMPIVNETFKDLGLFQKFEVQSDYDANGVVHDLGVLTVVNTDNPSEMVQYRMRCEVPQMKGASNMQMIGSMQTYTRRYLEYCVLDLAVPDDLDARSGKADFSDTAITEDQKVILNKLVMDNPEKGEALLKHYKVDGIANLTMKQASEAIRTMKAYQAKSNGISQG